MLAYVNLGTNDLPRAKAFYKELLAIVDASVINEGERNIIFGRSPKEPMLIINKPHDDQPASAGNGTMVALTAPSQDDVDALHAKVLELGGVDEGAPGLRMERFYLGYARDLDGNKLAFYARGAK